MADVFSVEKRSKIMSSIKSKNTGPEKKMSAVLKAKGFKFTMHSHIIGHPDFVMLEFGIILFVDGEFWHGHTMTARKRAVMTDYWKKKIDRNIERDKEVNAALKKMGWCVIRVTDRVVNKHPESVVSKIWRAHGQLVGKNRKMDPEPRIAALRKTLNKKNTKCKKTKTSRQMALKQPVRKK